MSRTQSRNQSRARSGITVRRIFVCRLEQHVKCYARKQPNYNENYDESPILDEVYRDSQHYIKMWVIVICSNRPDDNHHPQKDDSTPCHDYSWFGRRRTRDVFIQRWASNNMMSNHESFNIHQRIGGIKSSLWVFPILFHSFWNFNFWNLEFHFKLDCFNSKLEILERHCP